MSRTAMSLAMAAALMLPLTPVAEPEARQPDPEPDPAPEPAPAPPTGSDGIPDRVCLEDGSPHYFAKWRQLGVRYNGGECNSVVEFCISEGWMRSQVFHGGRPKMERGKFVTIKRHGTIEPYWRSRT